MPARVLAVYFVCATLPNFAAATAREDRGAVDSIEVRVVGTLRTNMMAIGGETTGTTITAKGITWELEFGKNTEIRKLAKKLNGKKVAVRGSLDCVKGVEISQRWIVTVSELRAASEETLSGRGKPIFHATTGRTDTRIRIATDGETTVFDISSASGIDKATIERKSKSWPEAILVRLHLSGLESFKAGNKSVAVEWSVSSTGGNAKRVSLHEGREETPLDVNSPYHSTISIIGGNGKIPLEDGYFEVPLPSKLFEANPKEITLQWIDFYRN